MAKFKIIVGLGSCGIAAGAKKVYDKIKDLKENENLDLDLDITSCIGMCYKEPLVEVIDENGSYLYGEIDLKKATLIIENHFKQKLPLLESIVYSNKFKASENNFIDQQVKIVLKNCGKINPENINDYEINDGYKAIKKIVENNTNREQIIKTIVESGLRGRGGGGFLTGLKWQFAFNEKAEQKYIICNADEGDPGAFMDRSVLEGDPHSVIEGMTIAAYAIGATKGYIYCRAEYPLAIKRLNIAINQAIEKGYLGENIFNKQGLNFDLKVKEGAGAFVCGEETALIASIEGKRGMPRKRPPFPAKSGLWGKPTNINNVETYANVAWIILNGSEAYAKYGTEKSKGTKVFALAGKVNRSGLVEVPMGMTLRDIIFKLGGGIKEGKRFKAVQLGGPSGGCIPEYLADTVVDYDSLKATGAIMGSGGLIVMDETNCMVDVAKYFLEFTCAESCGKCTFCRIGTKRMLEILERITNGEGKNDDLEKLENLSELIKSNSLCGLGQTAPNPVLTTIKYFRDEYEAHINHKKCPAKVCSNLLTYNIIPEKCTGCTICATKCPVKAIDGERKKIHVINQQICTKCGICFTKCKFNAIEFH